MAKPIDPENEVLAFNGTRYGLFLGALAAKRYVGGRTGHPAVLIPNPFDAAYSAAALDDALCGRRFLRHAHYSSRSGRHGPRHHQSQ